MLSRWIFNRSAESRFGNGIVLAFLVAQALDGVLTYVGLTSIGRVAEGNPLVASLMAVFGLGTGLAGAKLVAGSLGIALHLFGTHRLVALLTAIYVVAAIGPWAALIATMS
ncbi:MAG TPA: DUF5658 family protein [Vicinamibacterales bacterium]|jgi:hypothetical protein